MDTASERPGADDLKPQSLARRNAPAADNRSVLALGGVLLAVAALYVGRDLFIPIALASLLAFALTPVVLWLRRRGLHRGFAVLLTVAAALAGILGIGYLVASQAIELVGNLPVYQKTLSVKLAAFNDAGAANTWLGNLLFTAQELRSELAGQTGLQDATKPVPVVIEEPAAGPVSMLLAWIGPLVHPLATAGIVLVFLVIFLARREDLRDRFIKLVSGGDLRTSTAAMDEAAKRVSRYLLMQLVVNGSYSVVIGAGLFLIGVPNAVLWGVLAGVLRFIPIVGQFIAALFPLALAFAIEPGWQMFALVAALFIGVELVYDYLVEPMLYSSSTGLSTLAIIIAAIFWTTLWGPAGLILAVPLSACIIVVGRHVPQLRFLDTVLGSEPALSPAEKLYQRLLAGNMEEAIELGERDVESRALGDFFDDVAVKALRLAEQDRALKMSDVRVRRLVADGMIEVARESADHVAGRASDAQEEQDLPRSVGVRVLAIGGRSELDRAAAEMVALALRARGIGAEVLPPMVVRQHGLAQVDLRGVEAVCLCYLDADPRSSIRYISRRLKQRAPEVRMVACLLNPSADALPDAAFASAVGVNAAVDRIERAAVLMDGWVSKHPSDPMLAPGLPENEMERLRALQRLGLTTSSGRYFDDVAKKVSAAFNAPIALVTVVDEEHQHWPGAAGLPSSLDACRVGDRDTSICGHVVAKDDVLVVEDVAADARFANNPFLLEHGIRFYAGAPLRTLDGYVIGSLCVIDYKPRAFGDDEKKMLSMIANNLMSKVEMNCYGFDMLDQDPQDLIAPRPFPRGASDVSAIGSRQPAE